MDPLDRLMRVHILTPIPGRDDLKQGTVIKIPKRGALALVDTGYAARVTRDGEKISTEEPLGEKHPKTLTVKEMLLRLPPAVPAATPAPKLKKKAKPEPADG